MPTTRRLPSILGDILAEGIVKQKRGILKTWRTRCIVLRDACSTHPLQLERYVSRRARALGQRPRSIIPLTYVRSVIHTTKGASSGRYGVTLEFTDGSELLEFWCGEASKARMWLRILSDVCTNSVITQDQEIYLAYLVAAAKLTVFGECRIKITDTIFYVLDARDNKEMVKWPVEAIRKYGSKGETFVFESGRRCDTGEATFKFKTRASAEIDEKLRFIIEMLNDRRKFPPVHKTTEQRVSHAPDEIVHTHETTFLSNQALSNGLKGGFKAASTPDLFHRPESYPAMAPTQPAPRPSPLHRQITDSVLAIRSNVPPPVPITPRPAHNFKSLPRPRKGKEDALQSDKGWGSPSAARKRNGDETATTVTGSPRGERMWGASTLESPRCRQVDGPRHSGRHTGSAKSAVQRAQREAGHAGSDWGVTSPVAATASTAVWEKRVIEEMSNGYSGREAVESSSSDSGMGVGPLEEAPHVPTIGLYRRRTDPVPQHGQPVPSTPRCQSTSHDHPGTSLPYPSPTGRTGPSLTRSSPTASLAPPPLPPLPSIPIVKQNLVSHFIQSGDGGTLGDIGQLDYDNKWEVTRIEKDGNAQHYMNEHMDVNPVVHTKCPKNSYQGPLLSPMESYTAGAVANSETETVNSPTTPDSGITSEPNLMFESGPVATDAPRSPTKEYVLMAGHAPIPASEITVSVPTARKDETVHSAADRDGTTHSGLTSESTHSSCHVTSGRHPDPPMVSSQSPDEWAANRGHIGVKRDAYTEETRNDVMKSTMDNLSLSHIDNERVRGPPLPPIPSARTLPPLSEDNQDRFRQVSGRDERPSAQEHYLANRPLPVRPASQVVRPDGLPVAARIYPCADGKSSGRPGYLAGRRATEPALALHGIEEGDSGHYLEPVRFDRNTSGPCIR